MILWGVVFRKISSTRSRATIDRFLIWLSFSIEQNDPALDNAEITQVLLKNEREAIIKTEQVRQSYHYQKLHLTVMITCRSSKNSHRSHQILMQKSISNPLKTNLELRAKNILHHSFIPKSYPRVNVKLWISIQYRNRRRKSHSTIERSQSWLQLHYLPSQQHTSDHR